MASDTTDGSTQREDLGQEVMLKNKSYFKKSTGDEAGSAPKKGVVTSKNMGKVYFNAWSMDVKVEGENVVRHLDITHTTMRQISGTSPSPGCTSMRRPSSWTKTAGKKRTNSRGPAPSASESSGRQYQQAGNITRCAPIRSAGRRRHARCCRVQDQVL